MPFVLDGLTTMSWIFAGEVTEESLAVRSTLLTDHAIVPSLWRSEVGNTLLMAERRGRLSGAKAIAFLKLLEELPIVEDHHSSWHTTRGALQIAKEYNLTVYDATYLELAVRHWFPLVTLDLKLKSAGLKAGLSAVMMKRHPWRRNKGIGQGARRRDSRHSAPGPGASQATFPTSISQWSFVD